MPGDSKSLTYAAVMRVMAMTAVVPSLSRGGVGWGWVWVVVHIVQYNPTPIPAFPLKGKEKPKPPWAAHGFICAFEALT